MNRTKQRCMMIGMLYCCGLAPLVLAQNPLSMPWSPLTVDVDVPANWLDVHIEPAMMVPVNGGAYALGFQGMKDDNSPRGMKSLCFVKGDKNNGHIVQSTLQGTMAIRNAGDNRTFSDLLLLVAIDANALPADFSLTLEGHYRETNSVQVATLDPNSDFVYYDPNALGYPVGRPSGCYTGCNAVNGCRSTVPASEPVSYLFDRGMVSLYAFKAVDLLPTKDIKDKAILPLYDYRVSYSVRNLHTAMSFNVYGYDAATGLVYHTNRSIPGEDPKNGKVSTFAVQPQAPEADFTGDWYVDINDLDLLAQHYGLTVEPETPAAVFDLSRDGIVDRNDLEILMGSYESLSGYDAPLTIDE
jgi:hypothetical protein